jgi:hypothetical protein
MSGQREQRHRVLPKHQTFVAERHRRAEKFGERTHFNVDAIGREYKLAQAYANVRNLEYRSDGPLELQSFDQYLAARAKTVPPGFEVEIKPRPDFPDDEAYRNQQTGLHYPHGEQLILVDKALYDGVSASIDQYVLDVARDGYWATVHAVSGGTPADIRAYIDQHNPVGVLMLGAIPAAWYEIGTDQFPCDLYYMDRNGTWTDPDGDGKFQGHSGDVDPETWVGRLWTPTANGNDASLINDYFARNHRFRYGGLGHARSALAYVDDDWPGFDDCEFDQLFPSSVITKYTDPNTTDADLYKAEVNSLRSWVQLCAHSWPLGHALWVPASNENEYIHAAYFRDRNSPNAHFYNLFCCGPGKFTTPDYLAGWYVFDQSTQGTNHGLAAVASAKSGSMLFFADFYRPMGQGQVIGDAYLEWWKARGPDHDDDEKAWFYGLVLLGDPTLTWWKGAVPQPRQPQTGDQFDHWPRKTQFRWDPVNLPDVKYSLEVDAFGAVNSGQWAEETGQTFATYHNIADTTFDHTFVGKQRGRWRVRAVVGGTSCCWSPWQYFEFTV